MITNFKIFEEIDRSDRDIKYKKGDYIFWDNAVQTISEVGLQGWIGWRPDPSRIGKKNIRFFLYNEITKKTDAVTLAEDEIVLPTDEQLIDFKNTLEAIKKFKKYNI